MKQLFEIRHELNGLDNKKLLDEPTYRRLMLQLLLHNAVALDLVAAAMGGNADWRYEQELVTTEDRVILPVKKGDLTMVRIHNWDDEELRVVYFGTDGPVTVDQGIPLQPGEEKTIQIQADLHAISPYKGDLIDIYSAEKNSVIPISENGTGGPWLRALIPHGQYDTGQAYALAAQTAMNAAGGGSTYTCVFNVITRKISYGSDGLGGAGTFDLGYKTGDGHSVSNWQEAGFRKMDYPGPPPCWIPPALSYTSTEQLSDNPIRVRIGKARPFKKNDRDFF